MDTADSLIPVTTNTLRGGLIHVDPIARCITAGEAKRQDWETCNFVAHSLRAECFDASEDGTGRGTPLVPVAFMADDYKDGGYEPCDTARPLTTSADRARAAPIAFDMRGREGGAMPEGAHDTANIRAASGGSSRSYIAAPMQVRRLTPEECEALQGFPRSYTAIKYRGKPAADGPRYKALGNSFAVPVVWWIGQRIQMVDEIEMGRATT